MYEHVREVSIGLILSLMTSAIAGIVAWVADPWFNYVAPWVSWIVISIVGGFAVAAATFISVVAKTDDEFFGRTVVTIVLWAIVVGLYTGLFIKMDFVIHFRFHSLAWFAYGAFMGIFIVTAMIQYLAGARAEHGSNRSNRSNCLNRVE